MMERVTNGGAEDGNTGWTVSGANTGSSTGSIYEGDRAFRTYASIGGPAGVYGTVTGFISQTVDFTNVDELTFWYRVATYTNVETAGTPHFRALIGGTAVFTRTSAQSSWTKVTVDTSGITGEQTLRFESYAMKIQQQMPGGSTVDAYIDSISALAPDSSKKYIDLMGINIAR